MDFLAISLFGLPGAFLSLIISALGILKNKVWLVLLGMLLFLPFCLYLDGTPNFRGTTLLSLFHLAVAYAVRLNRNWLAWIFLLPSAVLIIFVFSLAVTSPR